MVKSMVKRPWLYSRWDFRDTFHKLVFHVIWCGNILKIPMGHISGVAEPFFLKIIQMWWNLDFFCLFGKICCWFGLQITTNTLGLFEKGVWRWTSWKISIFFQFLTCFLTCFDGFFTISKKSGIECPKKKIKAKI